MKHIVVTPGVKINEIIDVKESISDKEGINLATCDGNLGFAGKPWNLRFVISDCVLIFQLTQL